jgi:hypothetical protein
MISKLLKFLLLIYACISMTRLCAQQDSGKICLSYPEFDYYAAKLVEHKYLKLDTASLNLAIFHLRQAISARNAELNTDSLMFIQKDQLFADLYKEYQVTAKREKKAQKKVVFWRRTAVVLGVAVLVETLVLFTDH